MADLTSERVNPSPPFTYCGMDCFDPFLTRQGRKVNKRYGQLFTCLCCRAVHSEMLNDMSTDAFINSLRCFIALRGTVGQIRCGQGTNFCWRKKQTECSFKATGCWSSHHISCREAVRFRDERSSFKPCRRCLGETYLNSQKCSSFHTLTLNRQAGRCFSADILSRGYGHCE